MKNEILKDILLIIKNINRDIPQIDINNFENLYFFGRELTLQPRDLVYLLNEISIQYNKDITSNDIQKYTFRKVGDLVRFLMEN